MTWPISRRGAKVLALTGLGIGLAAVPSAACAGGGQPTKVCGTQDVCQTNFTLLHTGDVHSRLFPYDLEIQQNDSELGLGTESDVANVGGIARMSYILARERAKANRVIHLSAGDYFEGAPIFNFSEGISTPLDVGGQPEIQCASAIGTDAMVLGNHEFDFGSLNAARQIQAWADFPVLAANYQFYDTDLPNSSLIGSVIKPFTVLDQDGLRIAVIGMGNLSSLGSIFTQPNSLGILPLQTEETAQFYVDLLRPYVDLVVIVSHLGIDADEAMVQGTTGIDIVAGGHNHIVVDPPQVLHDCSADPNNPGYVWAVDPNIQQTAGGTPPDDPVHPDPRNHPWEFQRPCKPRNVIIMQSGAFSKYVGRLDAVLSNDPLQASPSCQGASGQSVACDPKDYDPLNGFEVISNNYQVFPITAAVPDDPAIDTLLQPYQRFLDQVSDLTVLAGFSPSGAKRTPPEDGDSPLGNLVSTSMWLQLGVQTDFSMTNTSGIRTDLNSGPVPIDELYDIFPFDNTITTMELSGLEVRELFDFVARRSQARGCESQAQVAGVRMRINCSSCSPTLRPDTVAGCNSDADCSSGAIAACNLSAPFGNMKGTCLVTPCAEEIYIGQETDLKATSTCKTNADCPAGQGLVCESGTGACVFACTQDSDCAKLNPPICQLAGTPCTGAAGQEHPTLPQQCFVAAGVCWAPISLTNVYSLATNDYVATGGSGFKVLQRNTTQLNTEILQRDALIDYMREGHPCGYSSAQGGLLGCAVDKDCAQCTGPVGKQTCNVTGTSCMSDADCTGFVCACPGGSQLDGSSQTCTNTPGKECGSGVGQCVRQDCRDQVAQYHLTACASAPAADVTKCVEAVNPCTVGGEECKYLSCVDNTESAVVDNRITVVQ